MPTCQLDCKGGSAASRRAVRVFTQSLEQQSRGVIPPPSASSKSHTSGGQSLPLYPPGTRFAYFSQAMASDSCSWAEVVTGAPCPTTMRSTGRLKRRSILRRAAARSEKPVHRITRLSATPS